jgi:hypothetical protein
MNEPPIERLPEDIEALLGHERVVPSETAVSAAELWRELEPRLGAQPPSVAAPPPGGAATLAGSKLVIAAISFALGAGTVALIAATRPPVIVPTIVLLPTPPPPSPPPTVQPVAEPVPPAPEPSPAPVHRREVKPAIPAPPPPPPTSIAAQSPPRTVDDALAEERALIELARTALSRTRIDDAVGALKDHEKRFPHGRLAEERESLWIRCLMTTGHRAEARERVAHFREEFPNSMLLPALEQALRENP